MDEGRLDFYFFPVALDKFRPFSLINFDLYIKVENRFVLYYQPIVPLSAASGYGNKAEIIVRLVNEDGSIARPGDFIPAAERYNLMPLIDRWVLRNALAAYRLLADRGSPLAERMISSGENPASRSSSSSSI